MNSLIKYVHIEYINIFNNFTKILSVNESNFLRKNIPKYISVFRIIYFIFLGQTKSVAKCYAFCFLFNYDSSSDQSLE